MSSVSTPASGFAVGVQVADGLTVAEFAGELDSATEPLARAGLERMGATRDLVVDLSGLTLMTAAGLSALIGLRHRVQEAGGRLRLVRGPRAVHQLFVLSGLESTFEFVDGAPRS